MWCFQIPTPGPLVKLIYFDLSVRDRIKKFKTLFILIFFLSPSSFFLWDFSECQSIEHSWLKSSIPCFKRCTKKCGFRSVYCQLFFKHQDFASVILSRSEVIRDHPLVCSIGVDCFPTWVCIPC